MKHTLTNLLRQRLRPSYLEGSRRRRRSCIRLASANRNRISALSNNRLARFAHHAQIAILQLEAHLLRFAWVQVNALEAAQGAQRRSRHTREAEVKLRNLIACLLSGIRNCHFRRQRGTCIDRSLGKRLILVRESCVAQAIAKRVQRLALEVAIGAVLHRIIFEGRQLIQSGVERHRQPARGIILSG